MRDGELAILSFSHRGAALARRMAAALGGTAACTKDGDYTLKSWTAEKFPTARGLIFVGAVGIAVRAVAPYLTGKDSDCAVVAVDESGLYAVAVASGHLGGANHLAREAAKVCGGFAVISTATDTRGVFAADEWARVQRCTVLDAHAIKRVSAKALEGEAILVRSVFPVTGEPPEGVRLTDSERPDVWVDVHPHPELTIVPPALVLGVGCRRGTPQEVLESRFEELCRVRGIVPQAVRAAASIDLKADEPGLLAFCQAHGWPFSTYPAEALRHAEGTFSASDFVTQQTGVDNVCERSAVLSAKGPLLVKKYAGGGVTMALAQAEVTLDWRWKDG